MTGLLDPVAPGFACGSDTAHMSILGYDPVMYVCVARHLMDASTLSGQTSTTNKRTDAWIAACSHYRGRGSFEAMGAGLAMNKGDVAFKCNFATVQKVRSRLVWRSTRAVGRMLVASYGLSSPRD